MKRLVESVNYILNSPMFDLEWSPYHQRIQYHTYSKEGFYVTTLGPNPRLTLNYFLKKYEKRYWIDEDYMLWAVMTQSEEREDIRLREAIEHYWEGCYDV